MLYRLAQLAERYFADDPSTSIFKLRQFGENLVQQMAAITNTNLGPNASFVDAINALRFHNVLSDQAADAFHLLRREGNRAAHEMTGAHRDALTMLGVARALGAQYHRMRGNRDFRLGPLIPPPDPNQLAAEVADQLAELEQKLQDALAAKEQAQAVADSEAQAKCKETESRPTRSVHRADSLALSRALQWIARSRNARAAAGRLASPPSSREARRVSQISQLTRKPLNSY